MATTNSWFPATCRCDRCVNTTCCPLSGIAHIGYLPRARIIGLSKLARVAEHFACRPQRQERLTNQIADWLAEQLQPRGVGVVIEAEHSCMTLRGVQAAG